MSFRPASLLSANSLIGACAALSFSLLAGCGAGTLATEGAPGAAVMTGVLHGGSNPVVGAQMTLYVTNSGSYGQAATVAATATTGAGGSFSFTLPGTTAICPAGSFAYVTAYSGSTGATTNNTGSLLMVPVGACGSNYTFSGGVNSYTGPSLWIDEVTTAVSAYALGGFMSVTNAGVVNIGAPANNSSTASSTTPAAAGLAHAFANALSLVNISTGQPAAYTNGGTSATTGGVVPDAEIYTLGNILQACVNSTGTTKTSTAIANDGTNCGKLFSLVTPPPVGGVTTVPTNTLQAALDLAQFPLPHVNTWSSDCTAAGSGTMTATDCLFNLQPSIGAAFPSGLVSAPPDWTLAVVYKSGYGAQTGSSCTGTCPGLSYPFYVALDYLDNVYVLNFGGGPTSTTPVTAASYTNILGFENNGTTIFSSAEDTTNLEIASIGTDTASHVFGVNTNATAGSSALKVYSTSTGALVTTVTTGTGANEGPVLADPLNNIYIASEQAAINLRKATYSSGSYSIASVTTTAPTLGIAQLAYGNNLDLYLSPVASTSPVVSLLPNTVTFTKGTPAAPTYAAGGIVSTSITGNTSNASGIAGTSAGGAYTIDSSGITPITKNSNTSISAGSAIAVTPVISGTLYSRGLIVDGLNNAFSPDGADGSAVSGLSVYNAATGLNVGTYLGCYVVSSACGTTAGSVPMYSPRAAAIDSAGDIWVVSGASANLTELIGAGAPTWPGLSMGLNGEPK